MRWSAMTAIVLVGAAPQDAVLRKFREEFVELKAGTLRVGAIDVEIAAIRVAKYEVPQNLWEAVTGKNPSRWKGPRNSVELLSHVEAVAFCSAATESMRSAKLIGADEEIRLPTEAEWEYAARAGGSTRYSFGDDAAALGDHAWFTGNAAGNDPPVGAKKPNAWGLYDMHGYLWEWCADEWRETSEAAPEPAKRPLRGGSWKDAADRLTCAFRRAEGVDFRDDAVGLRCVLDKVRK